MIPRFVQLDRVGVKICGITTARNAQAVAEAGADALGFNFWPQSKRYIDPAEFQSWRRELPANAERIGVFVNAPAELPLALLEGGAIHGAQFHGDEGDDYCARFSGCWPIVRAFGVRSPETLQTARDCAVETVLLDAYCPGEYGGSGEAFDWALGQRFVTENPERKVVLAGGLRPENVGAAVSGVKPHAVDVASGVESEPGLKDLALVREFIAAALGS